MGPAGDGQPVVTIRVNVATNEAADDLAHTDARVTGKDRPKAGRILSTTGRYVADVDRDGHAFGLRFGGSWQHSWAALLTPVG